MALLFSTSTTSDPPDVFGNVDSYSILDITPSNDDMLSRLYPFVTKRIWPPRPTYADIGITVGIEYSVKATTADPARTPAAAFSLDRVTSIGTGYDGSVPVGNRALTIAQVRDVCNMMGVSSLPQALFKYTDSFYADWVYPNPDHLLLTSTSFNPMTTVAATSARAVFSGVPNLKFNPFSGSGTTFGAVDPVGGRYWTNGFAYLMNTTNHRRVLYRSASSPGYPTLWGLPPTVEAHGWVTIGLQNGSGSGPSASLDISLTQVLNDGSSSTSVVDSIALSAGASYDDGTTTYTLYTYSGTASTGSLDPDAYTFEYTRDINLSGGTGTWSIYGSGSYHWHKIPCSFGLGGFSQGAGDLTENTYVPGWLFDPE